MASYEGTEGDDTWNGSRQEDIAFGNGGDDHLWGDNGKDELHGGAGDDTLDGGRGGDWVDGGDGDDAITLYNAGIGKGEHVSGGVGYDVLQIIGGTGVTVDLTHVTIDPDIEVINVFGSLLMRAEQLSALDAVIGGLNVFVDNGGLVDLRGSSIGRLVLNDAGNQVYLDGPNASWIIGGVGDDVIKDARVRGDWSGDDRLEGGAGDDIIRVTNGTNSGGERGLFGGTGDDHIHGGRGADTIDGGAGRDRLTGGGGADAFVFAPGETSADATHADRITDFDKFEHDVIDLTHYDAVPGNSTIDAFIFVGTQVFDGDLGELRYEIVGDDTLVSGDVDGDMNADFFIRLNGNIFLGRSDFLFAGVASAEADTALFTHPELAPHPLLHLA